MENGPKRAQALSDSSNSLKKSKSSGLGLGNGKNNSFGFKKPTPMIPSRIKSSREDGGIKQDSSSKLVRSNSVPTSILGKLSTSSASETSTTKAKEEECVNNFYDFYDELYPEPEFLRDISLQDLKEYVITSPIEIGLDEAEDFRQVNHNDSVITEDDEVDMGEEDDSYPEIEKFPRNYATQVLMEDPGNYIGLHMIFNSWSILINVVFILIAVWMRDMNISYERDGPTISEPPYLEYHLESDLTFISGEYKQSY